MSNGTKTNICLFVCCFETNVCFGTYNFECGSANKGLLMYSTSKIISTAMVCFDEVVYNTTTE